MEEINTLSYDWEYGKEELALKVDSYNRGGGIYIGLFCKSEDGEWESFSDLTVNLPGYSLEPEEAFIEDLCSKENLAFIERHKLGKVLPETGHSGMCEYALVSFDLERLAEFDWEGIAEYRRSWGLEEEKEATEKETGRYKSQETVKKQNGGRSR